MPRIALLDYGMGNLGSVAKALEKVGGTVEIVSAVPEKRFDGVMLPGVGNFGDGMKNLHERGFADYIHLSIAGGIPFMGICLGMQMLMESSEEAPGVAGLGVFKGSCRLFPSVPGYQVPHVGWNQVGHDGSSRLLQGVPSGSHVYFVHSFYVEAADPAVVAGKTDYILSFASVLTRGKVFATQFHPEKSQQYGLTILKNFISACAENQETKKC